MVSSIPVFKGSVDEDAAEWIEAVDDLCSMYEVAEEHRVKVARIKLSGPAATWKCGIPKDMHWHEFRIEFMSRFGERQEAALARLARCQQQPFENVQSYADRFRRDAAMAERQEDAALRHQFVEGMHRQLRMEVYRKAGTITTISEIVEFAKFWEDCLHGKSEPDSQHHESSVEHIHYR